MRESAPRRDPVGNTTPRPLLADGSRRDRQTLVVGSDPAALATAGFLDQAGLDPLLADGPDRAPGPPVVTFWRSGLELLERLGLRRPVEEIGTPLVALECVDPARYWDGDSSTRPSLVALRRDHLVAVMGDHLAGRVRTTDRQVVSVQPTDAGVRATFESGVTEPFDTVATTHPTLLWDRDNGTGTERSAVHWWSFEWPASVPAPEVPTEAFDRSTSGAAAFTVPVDGGVQTLLVAADGTTPTTPLSVDALAERFGGLSETLADALAALDQTALQYRQTPHAVPTTPCRDGVALVGPATHTPVPGGCLGSALAVEDGWVLSDTLAYGPPAVEDALTAYADRRRRRLTSLWSTLDDDALLTRVDDDLSGLARYLCACRTVAFDHLFEPTAGRLTCDIPDQL